MEKLNSQRISAVNTTPNSPTWNFMDVCSRTIPSSPAVMDSGVRSMIIAVQLQMTKVSIKTPRACRSPSLAGWLISAAAAAQGADPEPASLENSPLLGPVHNDSADSSGHSLAQPQRFSENPRKYRRELARIFHNDKDRERKIAGRPSPAPSHPELSPWHFCAEQCRPPEITRKTVV